MPEKVFARSVVHLIDDDEAMLESFSFLLRSADLEVRSYLSARAFLDALPGLTLGCVITDIRMSDMSGIELLQHLKKRKIEVPVIVITGHGDVALPVEATKTGAADFFEKPFDDASLLASVRSALQEREGVASRFAERAEIERRLPRSRHVNTMCSAA